MSSVESGDTQQNPNKPPRTRRSAQETREHLMRVVYELFYQRGIHSVGVDEIAKVADIAPTTMYRIFDSKDELVAAYADHIDQYWRNWLHQAIAEQVDPVAKIRAAFNALATAVSSPEHRGCPFQMILAEYPDPTHNAHIAAVANKTYARNTFRDLARAAAIDHPNQVGDQLALLFDGAYANNQAMGPRGPVRQLKPMLELILRSHPTKQRNITAHQPNNRPRS